MNSKEQAYDEYESLGVLKELMINGIKADYKDFGTKEKAMTEAEGDDSGDNT